jgi:hypothetical protein
MRKMSESTFVTDDQEKAAARMKLAAMRQEHDDMDSAIDAMITVGRDFLQIQRMKRKKLELKDKIQKFASHDTPDIIA